MESGKQINIIYEVCDYYNVSHKMIATKTHYSNTEKLTLTFLATLQKLKPYF